MDGDNGTSTQGERIQRIYLIAWSRRLWWLLRECDFDFLGEQQKGDLYRQTKLESRW